MGIIAQDTFVKKLLASPAPVKGGSTYDPSWSMSGLRGEVAAAVGVNRYSSTIPAWLLNVDEASAVECYNQIKRYIQSNGYLNGKTLRPWHLDADLTSKLDRREAWFGFEFETGYRSHAARSEVIGYCWDNFDGVVFDSEGEGSAAVEITFTPEEESKFRDGTAQAVRFMDYLDKNRELIQKGSSMSIGTHLNISHPAMQAKNIELFCRAMQRTIAAVEQTEDGVGNLRQYLFGRSSLYGGFYVQNQTNGVWLEGKLFRTVYTMKEFQRYLQTAYALSASLNAIVAAHEAKENDWHRKLGHWPYVDNLFAVATTGEEPHIRWTVATSGFNQNGGGGELSITLTKDRTPQTEAEAAEELKRKEEELRLRKIKEEEARLQALKEAEEEKLRREMHARGETPADLPADYTWCDDCGDWHD